MSALNLAEIVAYGRKELAEAKSKVLRHQPSENGMCRCGRAWISCRDENSYWSAYAKYWDSRLYAQQLELAKQDPLNVVASGVPR